MRPPPTNNNASTIIIESTPPPPPLPLDGSKTGTINSSSSTDPSTCKQVLSQMIVYNAFRSESSLSIDSSIASYTGIKPSAAGLLEESNSEALDLSTLSKSFSILLIIRKFVVRGGCPYCNRRMSEINEWRRSLLQLGIVPVVVHSESPEIANTFFRELCNPQLRDIWRVSDASYSKTELLCKAPDSGHATPLKFSKVEKFYALKKINKLIPIFKEGYFDPVNRFKKDIDEPIDPAAFDVGAKMMLIRDDQVVKTWDHKKEDHAPDILGDVIMGMDWLTREMVDDEEESNMRSQNTDIEMDLSQADEERAPTQIELSITENEVVNEQKSIDNLPNVSKISMDELDIPTLDITTNVIKTRHHSEGDQIQIDNQNEEPEFAEPLSPASPVSPTKSLATMLESLHMEDIDIYRKQKGKFQFTKVSSKQQKNSLSEQTTVAKRKIQDLKAQQSETNSGSNPERSNTCLPFRLPSKAKKPSQAVSVEDLVESTGSITALMENEKKRRYLKLFSVREYNAESVLFWEDVNLFYRKLFERTITMKIRAKIFEHSHRIANRYLFDEESLFLLNTTERLRERVRIDLPKNISELQNQEGIEKAKDVFDSVMGDIMAHVLPDIFVRFVFSDECKQMKSELGMK